MSRIVLPLFCVLVVFLSGCYADNFEDLYPVPAGSCDTTNVSFAQEVRPILNASCATAGCHNQFNAGGYNFTTIQGVREANINGALVGSIRHASGYSQMPKSNQKLPACEISKIAAWVAAGSPDN
jgi:hypothetical protein